MKRARSAELFARAQTVSPGGVHSPVRAFGHVGGSPVFVESAHGASFKDADGNSYTDYCMAFGPLILGHRNAGVETAAAAALSDGWSFGTAERYSLELAEFICARVACAERMRFVNSGTEAVMAALRVARAATGRDKVLKFSGCYHGHSDAMLIEAGSGMSEQTASPGIPVTVAKDTLVAELDNEEQLNSVFAEYGNNIAATIIEPLPANYGLLPQRQAFLSKLRELCTRHSALLIFDEVISGFRTGFGGQTEQSGVAPDLLTWGKIIGGGFPVGAYAGRQELLDLIAPAGDVYQAGTLSANPLAMRAGLATLEQLDDGQIYGQLEELGTELESGIQQLPGLSVERHGSIFWLRNDNAGTARDVNTFETARLQNFSALFNFLLEQGIYLPPSPYEVAFISAAHSNADINALISACAEFTQTC